MPTRLILSFLVCGALALPDSAWSAEPCSPMGMKPQALKELRQQQWQVNDHLQRQQLAKAMLTCLASPDPALRDEIAFESLSFWMRGKLLDVETIRHISEQLQLQLSTHQPSKHSDFARPFAALVMAEVARVDRITPFLSEPERSHMVKQAATFLSTVKDYRGYDEKQGWRHGVAHGADWMLQLSLNPALTIEHHQLMLQALASQIKTDQHFYQYGESERLMMPILYLALRSPVDQTAWQQWFDALLQTELDLKKTTQRSLARRHNLQAFFNVLYLNVHESKKAELQEKLLPLLVSSIKKLN